MASTADKGWRWYHHVGLCVLALVGIYMAAAYVLMPQFWRHYADRHPVSEDQPGMTYTPYGIPADPINVALVGTEAEVIKIMLTADWHPADPLTLKSCLKIAEASILKRPDINAPVSSEYLFGRKEDLAFEQPVGSAPRQRHHVRIWKSDKLASDGRPLWIGAAIFDKRIGLSHTTGQITHETAADIDAERDKLFDDLERTDRLSEVRIVEKFHKVLEGRNGEGNQWYTDGNLLEGWIKPTTGSAVSQTQEVKPEE